MNVDRVAIKKNTDQLNFEDFLGGVTRDVTIKGVDKGRKEAQYDIAIEGDDRYWRPPPTVLKLLVLAYTDDATNWVGKRARLYGDPNVMMAGKKVGGIRVSHLSHIDKPLTASLTITRGKSGDFTVQPLVEAKPAPEPTAAEVAACTDVAELRSWWSRSGQERREQIKARVADLENEPEPAA